MKIIYSLDESIYFLAFSNQIFNCNVEHSCNIVQFVVYFYDYFIGTLDIITILQ